MRLIDADELKKNYQDELCKGIACAECSMQAEGFCRAERWIDIAPTVEVEPTKHGRWVYDEKTGNYYCSECHRRGGVYIDEAKGVELLGNYCGNCGARMEETA